MRFLVITVLISDRFDIVLYNSLGLESLFLRVVYIHADNHNIEEDIIMVFLGGFYINIKILIIEDGFSSFLIVVSLQVLDCSAFSIIYTFSGS